MSKPVIVYGASGYTGRLVCEYLREYNVPFIAAGRDKARIAEAMDKVPGIDTREWPTSRRWAACSTARSCSACRRSSRASWRRSRACRTARSSG